MDQAKAVARLHADLGLKRLHRLWAKLEILFGLTAVFMGLLLGVGSLHRPDDVAWEYAGAAWLLFVCGGYLAMAGHRSHLYQSNNELAAYLAETIRHTDQRRGDGPAAHS